MTSASTRSASRKLCRLALGIATAVGACAIAIESAHASSNVAPSSAVGVGLGVPFSGSWPGTGRSQPSCNRGNGQFCHWWRLSPLLRRGDKVTLAVDHSAGDRGTAQLSLCLLSPVDDFDANAAVGGCQWTNTAYIAQDRETLTYAGATGQAFLVVNAGCCSGSPAKSGGQYTATVERVTTRVDIGAVPPNRVARAFRYTASVRYGDNTTAADGLRGVLEWRRAKGTPGPRSFKRFSSATSSSGRLSFRAKLPRTARRKLQLRACVQQPGGGQRCTPAKTVKIRR